MNILLEQLARILSYAGIAQGFFVALLLNNKSVRRSRANLFLSVLLIALSFSVAHILFAGAVINHMATEVYSVGDPTFLLIAPLLWLYTKELVGQKVKVSFAIIIHFLPFLIIIVLSVYVKSIQSIHPISQFFYRYHWLIAILFWIGVVLQFSCYQIFIHKRWLAYQEVMQQEVSNKENISISWVKFFMGVFLIINLLFLFSLFAVIHLEYRMWLYQSIALIFSLSIFALGYKGILQKEIFYSIPRVNQAQTIIKTSVAAENTADNGTITRLLDHMEKSKPYLNPDLTLTDLAKDLNMSRSQLSLLINDSIGNNFYDFINKYRVEQVKKLMNDPQMKNFNMLGIALEAGFKSKSTFNLIFKRFTGLTPTAFRKNNS